MRYDKDSAIVTAVATLLGCKADSGLVNRMNNLKFQGWNPGTVGEWYAVVVRDMLAELEAR